MKKGFTLVETMATIAVFALAMGLVVGLIVMTYRTYGQTWQKSSTTNEARKTIETMVQEIRKARSGEDGSYLLGKADDGELIIYSDIDKDSGIERVRYFWQAGETTNSFKKGVTEPFDNEGVISYPLDQEQIENLSSFVCNDLPVFRYFDSNNQEIIELSSRTLNTRLIQVYLAINADSDNPSQNFELLSSAQIRNLKEE
ncbi:MAG TPA: type II secretion system protein [Candidatus Paceibacterota bacterium]|nr:type II secretion system protein [Candidatus Paceibacterota bacterium]